MIPVLSCDSPQYLDEILDEIVQRLWLVLMWESGHSHICLSVFIYYADLGSSDSVSYGGSEDKKACDLSYQSYPLIVHLQHLILT